MPATITDKFSKAYNGQEPNVATVSAPRAAAGTTLACDNLAGWPTDTVVDFITFKKNTSDELVPGSITVWRGIVSGNNIGTLTRVGGATDAGSEVNDIVEMTTTGYGHTQLVEGILVSHDQDGTLKAGAVDNAAALASNVVETAKIKDLNVTTAKLANGAVTAEKMDLSTSGVIGYAESAAGVTPIFSTGSIILSTGAITIPAGVTKVLVETETSMSKNASGSLSIAVRDNGADVATRAVSADAGKTYFLAARKRVTVVPGSIHTFEVAVYPNADTGTVPGDIRTLTVTAAG